MNRLTLCIAILFVLLIATNDYWWTEQENVDTENVEENLWQPDYEAFNMSTKLYDEDGNLAHQIHAKNMEHYDELGFTLLGSPQYVVLTSVGDSNWEIEAQEGTLFDNQRIRLETQVKIQSLNPQGLIQTIETDYLELDLNKKTMTSDQTVIIRGINYVMSGTGFFGDLNQYHFELQDHAKTTFDPNR